MKLSIIIFFLVSSNLYSSNVSGAITNSSNGKSIPNANIYIKELEIGSVSNSYGTFKIDVPKGQYLIQITNIGFETFSSLINVEEEDIVLDIAMEPVILELDEVSVEALFSTRLGYESAKVILKSELQEFDRQSAADMLRMLPGVDAQYAYPDGRNVNLSIRGSSDYKPGGYNNRVLVLLDGFPMLIPNSGSPDWSSVPMESIERIEIDNSPASAQYGHNSMGGVINLITDHNHEKSLTTLSIGGGSFSTGSTSFSKKFKSKNWNFGFNGMAKISDGHRINSEHQLGKIRSFLKFNRSGRTYRLSHI
ncbi:MAG: TonB-dependent receptor, partial [Candidatus Neomarinimicrobiota bacterium]